MATIFHMDSLQGAFGSNFLENGALSDWDSHGEIKVSQEFHDVSALLNSIKASGKQKDLHKGHRLHAYALKSGLLREDVFVGTALLRMYANCGMLVKAQEVFNELPACDTASWNALISSYVQHELADEALHFYGQMQNEGLDPNAVTYLCVVKACGSIGAIDKGRELHVEASRKGFLNDNVVLGTAIVDMYAKCGAFSNAQEVFDELPARDVASWTALMAGYAQHGLGNESLNCYLQMKEEGLIPDTVTYICVLKACGSIGVLGMGEQIHSEVCSKGLLETSPLLGIALVDMYAKCGALGEAKVVLNELPQQEVASWTALIGGCVQHGHNNEALDCFRQMLEKEITPNAVTFACVLRACSILGALEEGEEIYGEVKRQGLLKENLVLGNAVVDMYAKCGALAKANHVLEELPARDLASWNALMSGYTQHGPIIKVLECFQQMRDEGLSPNAVTYVCVLRACSSIGAIEKGEEIRAEVSRQGLLEKSTALGSALVAMYAKFGMLARAQEVFHELRVLDVTSWNALISGYAQSGHGEEVLKCFQQMENVGQTPDAVTYVCVLKACGTIGAAERGQIVHEDLCKKGLLEGNTVLGTALVDMYAKCGMLAKAREVFDELPKRDVVSWTALIGGYSQHGFNDEAFDCFGQMQDEGLAPNVVTFICILRACGNLGAIEKGKVIHAEVNLQGLLESNIVLSRALVDMYAKCGMLTAAQELFDNLSTHDVISWTSLLAGYAQLGEMKVFDLYNKMIEEGIEPNAITFVALLTVCSHLGLVSEGQMYFDIMCSVYRITPNLEHYTSMVDLFSRAGLFDKAVSLIKEVPLSNCAALWSALLSSCRKSTSVEFGSLAFEQALLLDIEYDAAYVCMSNLYVARGMQDKMDYCK